MQERGMQEWGTGNGERGTGNGEREMGNGVSLKGEISKMENL